jgi:hypothetical protein
MDSTEYKIKKIFIIETNKNNFQYIFEPQQKLTNYLPEDKNLILPLIVDTEFNTTKLDIINNKITDKLVISVQVKHALLDDAQFYITNECKQYLLDNNIKVQDKISTNIILDYIKNNTDHDVSFEHFSWYATNQKTTRKKIIQNNSLRRLKVILYAHFMIADINNIFQDNIFRFFFDTEKIFHQKRLQTEDNKPLVSDILIIIDGNTYILEFIFMDTVAIAGVSSYDELAKTTNVTLKYKGIISNDEKNNMLDVFINDRTRFINYALDDLKVYDILYTFNKMVKNIYTEFNLDEKNTSLTIGSTVNKLIKTYILDKLNTSKYNAQYNDQIGYLAPETLAQIKDKNIKSLAKQIGGRCLNNNPLHIVTNAKCIDIDIAGAYTTVLKKTPIFVGYPVLASSINDKYNINLKTFISTYKKYLKDGYWIAIIDADNLKYDTDIFNSRINDTSKIYTRQIKHAIIESNLLDLIDNLSAHHKADLYKNIMVKSFVIYDHTLEINTEDYANKNFKQEHSKININNGWINYTDFNNIKHNNFTTLKIGDDLVNKLAEERARHEKETPKNKLYKLIINTCYGSLVCKHFNTTNLLTTNIITATIRTLMYALEKTNNMYGSITDGQFVNLTKLPEFNKNINSTDYCTIYKTTKYIKYIDLSSDENITKTLLDRVKKQFNLKLFKKYDVSLEIKQETNNLITHSSSNYKTDNMVKYRSYSNKKDQKYTAYTLQNDKLVTINTYDKIKPQDFLLTQIATNKNNCTLPPVATTTLLLKSKQYINESINRVETGDTILKVVQPRYLSLSQFKFRTEQQYKIWLKCITNLQNKQYAYTFEPYFINENGNINYELMLITLDKIATKGILYPDRYLKRSREYNITNNMQIIIDSNKILRAKKKELLS